MHIQRLSIAPMSVHNGRDNHELFLGHEISNTALVLGRVMAGVCVDIEFQRRGKLQAGQQKQAAENPK